MRGGIQRYNRRVGIGTTDEGAYNETLTLFWLHHVWDHLTHMPADSGLLDLVNACVAEYGPQPDLALEHYSEAVLWSTAARKEWVEPDLRALSPKVERPPFLPPL
jgi:hypothetical protein